MFFYAEFAANICRCAFAVTGNHNDVVHTELFKLVYNSGGVLADGILYTENAAQRTADSEINKRILFT